MKILHVIATLDRTQGGPPPVVTGMCAALAARGHEVTLYSNASAAPFLSPQSASFNLEYFRLDWSPYQVSLAMAHRLRDLSRFDLVHTHMLYRFPQAIAAYQARRQGIPYCVQPHGALAPVVYKGKRKFWRSSYMAAIERRNLEKCAGIIFTARQELDWARELGFARRPPYIVPVGADIEKLARRGNGNAFRDRYGIGSNALLLWMGRLVESKGLDLLLSAFAAAVATNSELRLVLAGPDTNQYRSVLEKLVCQLGLTQYVFFTGMIEGEEKQQALCAADLFVLPSESENFGLAALEAMAVGCPVLVSPGVSIAADVAAAGAGFIVERESALWGRMIANLLDDKVKCAMMGQAAARFARCYDWSVVGKMLEDSYRTMMERQ
jgi:glycosyltransferase involved in cell wall biosynthesis